MSPVNPSDSSVTYANYNASVAQDAGTGARFVAGYVEAGIQLSALLASMAHNALTILAGVTIGLLIALLLIRSAARAISQPLEQLAEVAHAITQDDLPKDPRLPVNRHDEVGEIAMVLKGVIDGAHRITAKLDVDRTLLSMKVDSASKKLNKAEEQITRTRSQMKRVAYFDPVTGLPNRRLMLEQLAMLMQIAARERRHLGVLLIDLYGLRRINDTLGRDVADSMLREVSERVVDTIRHSDVISHDEQPQDVSRVGNDELCIILHGISAPDDAEATAIRLLAALQKPIAIDDKELQLSFYMGIALAPDHAKKPEELVRAADVAVNHARENDLKAPALFNAAMDEAGSERFQLELDLRKANFDQELVLHYQPQIDTETGRVIGAEALVRWNHPTRGMVPPFKFIPIAEESGQILALGNWILNQACRDIADLKARGVALPKVSVNVSAPQLTQDFVRDVRDAVIRHQLQPEELELELTESLLVQNMETVMERLTTLRSDVGTRLSVDDFGTGYSSLAYLSKFPLDELKVDRSFVMGMESDETAAKVTGAIIAIGRELDLEVVVEGVDSPAQFHRLRELGANIIQGFLFSKPLPLAELERFIVDSGFQDILQELRR